MVFLFLCLAKKDSGSAASWMSFFVLTYYVFLRSDYRYDFRIKAMFGSSLPPVVCGRAHVIFVGGLMSCL